MMLNKNVKTDGNATLLKLQYGHHRMTRSATQRRDSEDPSDRRLKSALPTKRLESKSNNNDAVKLSKKESMSDFYTKNPQLSKRNLTSSQSLDKKGLLSDSYKNLRCKSFGYSGSTDDIRENTFDPEEEYDFDADDDDPCSSSHPDATTDHIDDDYGRICKVQGTLPSGRFKRQLNSPVADMSHSLLGAKDIKSISVVLTSNLNIKDLDLSGNDLSGKGATYLAEGLKENVSVDDLDISECNISLDGLQAISALLLDMKPMKRLSFARNKFNKKHAQVLAEIILKNDYIEDLNLSGNEFSEDGGVLIGKALGSNVGIRWLDLSWNHIRREGAIAVCNALRFNQTIEDLDLSWNGLAEEGCRALQKSLPANHTLKELDLTSNRINVFSLRYFLDGLEKNDTLKTLLTYLLDLSHGNEARAVTLMIDKNPMTTDGAILIMKVLSKSEVSSVSTVHIEDIPINHEFLDALADLREKKTVKVYHRDPNRKKITQIVMERTLKDFDPALILFEYMKQENLRLIDLFRVFDTDASHTVSKTELKEGFVAINLPLSDDAIENLFEQMDLNENNEIEYDEYKIGYRKTMNKIRQDELDEDDKNIDTITQLRKLIQKALKESREAQQQQESKLREQKQASFRRASLTAVFKVAKIAKK